MRRFFTAFVIAVAFITMVLLSFFLYIRLAAPSQLVWISKPTGVYKPEIIGFQPYWLVGQGEPSYAKDVTTLAYFSLALEKDGTVRREDNPGEGEPGWVMVNSPMYEATLSAHRKDGIKLSLLVQNMVEEDILELIATPAAHAATLVGEVAPIMRRHGFTDLNLDIESFNKVSESARVQYVQFVQAVKDELTKQNLGTLTVELTPKSPVEMHLIDVARIGEIADYLVLMAYDYHYIFSSVAGPIAPIGGVPTMAEYDVETALKETLRFVPSSKVILGVPLYGYEWETLRDVPGSPVIPGSWQLATGKRMDAFTKTCTGCIKGFDDIAKESYVIYPGETEGHFQEAYYENENALQDKINLAKKYQLAGVAMWALGYEAEGMLEPITLYKNSVHSRGFGTKPYSYYKSIQPASFTLSPPTHALVGSIATMSGDVKKMGRDDEEYKPLEKPSPIVQGEAIATGIDGNVEVVFPNNISMQVELWGELAFSELLPPNIIIRQKGGRVTYKLLDTDVPWSVRALRSLVFLEEGEMNIEISGTRATVSILTGRALIGNIDADNVTTTYEVLDGQTALINENTQSVFVY